MSFHPMIPGDRFVWIQNWVDEALCSHLREAGAVILPQCLDAEFYHLVRGLCPRVFPNYDTRFKWEGKVGDAMLFWSMGVPHPKTTVFPRLTSLLGDHSEMGKPPFQLPSMPFVVKSKRGGEGQGTWLIRDKKELKRVLEILKKEELNGRSGFVIQEYIEGIDRDLRVVVIGRHVESYWRLKQGPGFHSNIARGGKIEKNLDPHLKRVGEEMVLDLCRKTGINLAGFDIIFKRGDPCFLEINYTFGRSGIGGSERFYSILKKEVEAWLDSIGMGTPSRDQSSQEALKYAQPDMEGE